MTILAKVRKHREDTIKASFGNPNVVIPPIALSLPEARLLLTEAAFFFGQGNAVKRWLSLLPDDLRREMNRRGITVYGVLVKIE